jgi:2-oxoglutarate ferredoxin oxidoreductase subunit beta
MIDVLSPCVTFNDHQGSTKSYAYVKEHEEALGEINFVPYFDDISIDYEPGTTTEVKLHDGSRLYLKKVSEDYNPTDKHAALRLLQETDKRGEFATGILYVAPGKQDLVDLLNIVDEPLATLSLSRVRPPKSALDEFMEAHR